jgi:hypothetical protein
MPSLRASFHNLAAPMPLSKKLRLLWQNNLYKVRHHTNCCGHPGEPGC